MFVCLFVCPVPDDWCAPLGFETAAKQEVGFCPSVKLRPLSIALWPLKIIKQEVCSQTGNPDVMTFPFTGCVPAKKVMITISFTVFIGAGSNICQWGHTVLLLC